MNRNFDILHRQSTQPARLPAAAMAGPVKGGSAHRRDYRAVAEDELAKLVQRVFVLPGTAREVTAVAFCGVDEGAGCSWVCARVSEVLAEQAPGKVCVIDANLRSPSLHDYFRVEMVPGFADAMKDPRPAFEFTCSTGTSNLRLITAGAVGKDPNGALDPARLRSRFSELRGEFDYLLIDTPPISCYADAVLLGQLTDGVILVVGSNSTRREPARIAKESFEAAKVPMLGAVLNKRTYPIPEALYQRL
jgi:capsular exopolysaccharide synthesis family protein